MSAGFVNHLPELVRAPVALWIHGHTHTAFDYTCRRHAGGLQSARLYRPAHPPARKPAIRVGQGRRDLSGEAIAGLSGGAPCAVESASTATDALCAADAPDESAHARSMPPTAAPATTSSPGTHPLAIYPDETHPRDHWGYCPHGRSQKKLPQTINARAETASTSALFPDVVGKARVLVPADGWFEWRVEERSTSARWTRNRSSSPISFAETR